jgi:hypothetical protein
LERRHNRKLSRALLLTSAIIAFAQAPDLALINGKIITVNAADSVAQAVAIRGGKIVAMGSNAEIQRQIAPATRLMDLHGRTATPGLIDTQGHFADGGVSELYRVVLSDARSVDDALPKIRAKAATLKPGEWLREASKTPTLASGGFHETLRRCVLYGLLAFAGSGSSQPAWNTPSTARS